MSATDFEDPEYKTREFDLASAFAQQIEVDLMDYAKATARRDDRAREGIQADLADTIAGGMATSDLFARASVLEYASKIVGSEIVGGLPPGGPGSVGTGQPPEGRIQVNPRLAKLPFIEAIEDLVTRKSKVLAPLAEKDQQGLARWERVALMYQQEHAFALSRSMTQEVTDKVHEEIGRAMKEGVDVSTLSKRVEAVGKGLKDWNFAYSEMAVRTNLKTAYTAGQFQQMKSKGVRRAISGFERVGINDNAQRETHHAGVGLVAAADDPVWEFAAPPSGYR